MTAPPIDPAQVILVNESASEVIAGDVSIFSSIAAAQMYLEPWWVEDREGLVVTALGASVEQCVVDGRVVLRIMADTPARPELALSWLTRTASAVQEADRTRERPVRAIPTTIVELIQYIGFNR